MIAQTILDQILDRVDIVEIVSRHVALRKAGRSFKAPCPFHSEKSPSFIVTPDKQIFHCFGCGAGGNVITFLMKYEKLNFREAVAQLADRAGISIPQDEAERSKESTLEPLYKILEYAADFYVSELKSSVAASAAKEYVARRALKPEAVAKFRVGLSPAGWDGFWSKAQKHFNQETALRAGLILSKQGGGVYDRFRERLMFPVRDVRGRVIGFGARSLDNSEPKYLNSPETDVYYKGRLLYGLHEAADGIRRENRALVVEGYMDVIACHQAGVDIAVASSGTALTPEQVRLLKRYTPRITMLYDADPAGQAATIRGLDVLAEEGCEVTVAGMPEGHDPDSYLKAFGADKFRAEVLGREKSFFEFKLDYLSRQHGEKGVDSRAKVAGDMTASIRRMPSEILKATWVSELSKRLGIAESSIWAEVRKVGTGLRRAREEAPAAAVAPKPTKASLTEKMLLGLSLYNEEVWTKAKNRLTPEDFRHEGMRKVARMVLETETWDGAKPSRLLALLESDEAAVGLLSESVHETETVDEPSRAFDDCLRRVGDERRREKLYELKQNITRCEKSNDQTSLGQLLREYAELSKKGS